MEKRTKIVLAMVFCLLLTMWGCGSDDDEGSNNNPSGVVGETASETITAADGGTLETASGSAKLTVPAGALDEDLELSVTTVATAGFPDGDKLGSLGFEFGPDGTTFSTPVTIALAFDGTVPADHKAVLAVLEDGAWTEVEGSGLAGGMVSGETDHFSTYIILFVGDTATMITAECVDLEFTACGGDPTGTWAIKDICIEMQTIENPFKDYPECQDIVYAYKTDWTGTWTINGDGTFSVTNFGFTLGLDVQISELCLTTAWSNHTAQESCDEISENDTVGNCTLADGVCTCDGEPEQKTIGDMTGTWTTDGTSMTSEVEDGDGPETVEYCVDGNLLISEFNMGEAEGYIIMEKE